MHVIKTLDTVTIDGVELEAGHQYSIQHLTKDMIDAQTAGKIEIKSPTLQDRQADIKAYQEPK